MGHELIGSDRRVADPEGAKDLLLQAFVRECFAAGLGAGRLPEIRLEEVTRILEQADQALLDGRRLLRVPRPGYVPDRGRPPIGLEITLAIIGLVDLMTPTLGTMLNWALFYQSFLLGRWWWGLTPVVLSLFLFIALYWQSVSISEYLDPRTRIQRVGA